MKELRAGDMKDLEKRVEALTKDLVDKCAGRGAIEVVGAGLNVVMTAINQIEDKVVRNGLILSFRYMADQLEAKNATPRH